MALVTRILRGLRGRTSLAKEVSIVLFMVESVNPNASAPPEVRGQCLAMMAFVSDCKGCCGGYNRA